METRLLYNSIFQRYSCRDFASDLSLSQNTLTSLEKRISSIKPLLPSVRTVLVKEGFSRSLNNYSHHITPVDQGLIFIGKNDANSHIALGHTGEKAILWATTLDIATCWLKGTFDLEEANQLVKLSTEEKILAVSPLGREKKNSKRDKHLLDRQKSRKPVKDFLQSDDPALYPLFEAIRFAPSANNLQPWLFQAEDGIIEASLQLDARLPISYIDQGIAMFHAQLALNNAGFLGEFYFEDKKWLFNTRYKKSC